MAIEGHEPFRGSEAVRAGRLTRGELVGPGYRRVGIDTYAVATTPDTALARVDAALVEAGPDAVATGWSACVVHGLDVGRGSGPVEVAVPGRQPRSRPDVLFGRARIPDDEVTEVDGRRVTTAMRTAFDLAARSGRDPQALDPVVDPLLDAVAAIDALARYGAFAGPALGAFAATHPGVRGVRRVPRIAGFVEPAAESPQESRLRMRIVLAGLPRPVVQLPVHVGHTEFRLDLAWRRYMVAGEYDGRDHALVDRRGRDLDRLGEVERIGWRVVVVTALQLARPPWAARRFSEELTARGWRP